MDQLVQKLVLYHARAIKEICFILCKKLHHLQSTLTCIISLHFLLRISSFSLQRFFITSHPPYTRLGLPFVRHIKVSCCMYSPSPPIKRFSTTSTMQAIYSNQFNSNQLCVFTGWCGQELFRKFRGNEVPRPGFKHRLAYLVITSSHR